jgi:hypothetical protein
MDQMQTSYPTVIPEDTPYVTREFLQSQLVANKELIAQLKELHTNAINRSTAEMAERSRMKNEMQEWTLEEFDNGQITESQAEEIAQICGFELTRNVEAEVTVIYNITLQVPVGEDAEDIINDIDFESVSYNSDNISWISANVDRIDIS